MIRRRPWLMWAALAYAVIIAVVFIGLRQLYTGSRDRLDLAMGDRLLGVATSLAATLDGDALTRAVYNGDSGDAYLIILGEDLHTLAEDQDLAEISLTSSDGTVLISTLYNLKAGEPNDFWGQDPLAVAKALEGEPAASDLYLLQGTHQKSAYAPVRVYDNDLQEWFIIAVVTVSGNPDFFDSLAQLKRGALITGGVVLVVLVLVAIFLQRVNAGFVRYQESLRRQENLAAMGRMTAGIAHEIRNPLGIIRGAGEHLQRVMGQHGIEDPVATFIPEEVDRLDHILRGYLSFGTDAEVEARPFDLLSCLKKGAALLAEELSARGIALRLPSDDDSIEVTGDPLRLRQVILNLLINARDAMSGPGEIAVALVRDGDRACITVSDEGSGLAGQDPEQLFEPFKTTKEKGSGLGLAMSRRLIEEMGGTLRLADRRDRAGAVAEIRLPISKER